MGESVTEGTVLEWHVAEGDAGRARATPSSRSPPTRSTPRSAPASGTITKILVEPDDDRAGRPGARRDDRPAPPRSPTATRRPRRGSDAAAAAAPAGRRRRTAGLPRRPPRRGGERRRPERRPGLGPGRQGDQGRRARGGERRRRRGGDCARRRSPPARRSRCAAPPAMLAQAMNESRSMPTATSFRTLPVDVLDAKRKALNGVLKERGMKVSFTHLIAWAIVKAAQEWPVMGRSYEEQRRQAAGDRAGRRQPRDRGRRRAQGRLAQPDGPLHQGRRRASTSPASTPTTRT